LDFPDEFVELPEDGSPGGDDPASVEAGFCELVDASGDEFGEVVGFLEPSEPSSNVYMA
jgi:hypothetical protein